MAGIGSSIVFLVLLLFGRVQNENRMLLIIRAQRTQEDAIRKLLFAFFPKPPVIKAQNTTETTVEFIYEINRKIMEQAQTQSHQKGEESFSLTDKLYALGGVHYVNVVVQSDEIS